MTRNWPWLALCFAIYCVHGALSYRAAGAGRWVVPAGLCLSMAGASVWMLLARRCAPAELLGVGLAWDVLVTLAFLAAGLQSGAVAGLSLVQLGGLFLIVAGSFLMKVA